jgi:hypothetical protein
MRYWIITIFCLLTALICFGQDNARLPTDYETLRKISREELALKTEAHKAWGIANISRWDMNQDDGELIFSFADGRRATCPAQIIGSYAKADRTWLWAWANPSIDEKLKKDALKVRKYGEEHHIAQLTTRKFVGTEEDAWALTAIAIKLCGEQGGYRGGAGTGAVFLAFGEVTLNKN